ncbi:hypothetical protein M433DRAFT_234637 [Acidomyces richmondensis BFW]|nr:MAG: hypothetical protein FE78DRAFT_379110 [Acidomyces sp. 'richmondensis']KYG45861.1 hypothetical protein M433DRAFT_234637 [Acidomyces richmondensis BFW]
MHLMSWQDNFVPSCLVSFPFFNQSITVGSYNTLQILLVFKLPSNSKESPTIQHQSNMDLRR